ncbi:glycosyltransferase family 2 protein [Pseudanabaena sp. PCC 6802]|uniref:glycosyltransferase family 2 protein n=1 Tax=Pseudanabaena sp. PCC 6802 TaxID=118173 RepID=UPI0003620ABB|nr:glycosyltransferase [Pseudanabaena sp. PCC 6802]
MKSPSIYFLTVNYHSTELIRRLISSIYACEDSDRSNHQLIIVNNAIDDLAISSLEDARVTVIHALDNLGFGRACNLGLNWIYERDASATVWIINPDAYLVDGAIAQLNKLLQAHPEIAILGTSVYDTSGQLCFGGGKFIPGNGAIWEETDSTSTIQQDTECVLTDWVTACSMVLNLKHFSQCPYFDPDYFLYYEDFDFCRRYASQGHQIYFSDRIRVVHQTSAIASRNRHFKITNEIYSYLLSLEKHASIPILSFRLTRIAIASILQMFYNRQKATSKLTGVVMYCQRILRNPSH